jgi:hypothetical protein
MKIMKHLLVVAASAGLLAGCATDRDNAGGVGNQSQVGAGGISSSGYWTPPPYVQHPTGPNGSIGPGNPFGLGPGNTDNF